MKQFLKQCKIQMILLFCISCVLLGLTVVKITVSAKEEFPYYIKVNKLQNCVTIYEKDKNGKYTKPIKAMTCSTGSATPIGVYNTLVKYRWKLLMGDVWGQYSTRIVNGVLFHSVWYYDMDASTLSAKQYNKLGTSASHGCVRLTVADAKWIFDNCPVGTTVEIYSDKDPGPLGKPETLILKEGTGWDPTDPSKNNPFNDNTPTIKGASSQSIEWGKEINLLKSVKATSTTGTDITSKIKVKGTVDIYTAGKYKITYSVTDAIGRTAKKAVTVTVKDCKEKPKFKGIVDRIINSGTVVSRDLALAGVKVYLSTKRLDNDDINVKIEKASEDSYSIKYSIKGENGLVGTSTAMVYIDSQSPVLEGVSHKNITLEQLESGAKGIKKLAIENVAVTDDYSDISSHEIKVTVTEKEDYAYLVTYEVSDDVGNTTSETVQYTYFDTTMMIGIANQYNIPYGTELTQEFIMQGVTASDSAGDCTDQIMTEISAISDSEYMVTYTIVDEEGFTISVEAYFTVEIGINVAENTIDDSTD